MPKECHPTPSREAHTHLLHRQHTTVNSLDLDCGIPQALSRYNASLSWEEGREDGPEDPDGNRPLINNNNNNKGGREQIIW